MFQITDAGVYSISFVERIQIVTGGSLNNLTFGDAPVESAPITANFPASVLPAAAPLGKRTWINSNCDNYDRDVVNYILGLAKEYAINGQILVREAIDRMEWGSNHPLWDLYFNNDDTSTVLKAFRGLARYNYAQDENLDIHCRVNPRNGKQCSDRVGAFAKQSSPAFIVLCPAFFKLPVCVNCDEKAPGEKNQQVLDQPSILLHEFLHINHIAKTSIGDGPDPDSTLYSYDQIVEQARLQKFVQTNGPQDTASAYIMFLYSAMAASRGPDHKNRECHGTCGISPYQPDQGLRMTRRESRRVQQNRNTG